MERPSSVAERPKDWKTGGAGIRLQPVRDDYFVGTGKWVYESILFILIGQVGYL